MTRINSGKSPTRLIDTHVFAEWRELPRILTVVLQGNAKGQPIGKFKLGTGHVVFFYNKLKYLHNRYLALCNELTKRDMSFNQSTAEAVLKSFEWAAENKPTLYNDYDDSNDGPILDERLKEKFASMTDGKFRFYGKPITREQALNILNTGNPNG